MREKQPATEIIACGEPKTKRNRRTVLITLRTMKHTERKNVIDEKIKCIM